MGDLLKEAIADAKAVRETALQNAKMALEEAFTPQLKSMLSAKLREEEDEGEEEVTEDSGSGLEDPDESGQEMKEEEEDEDAEKVEEGGYYEDDEEFGDEEVPGEEVPGEVPAEEPVMAQDAVPGIPGEVPGEEVPGEEEMGEVIEINGVKYAPVAEQGEVPGEEVPGEEDALDLESIIRELEAEIGDEEEEPVAEENLGNGDPDAKDNAYSEDGKAKIKEISFNGNKYRMVENPEDKDNAYDEKDPGEQPEHQGGTIGEDKIYEIDSSLFEQEDDEEEKVEETVNFNGKTYRMVEQEDDEEEKVDEQTDSSNIGSGDNKVNVADASDEEDPEGGPGTKQTKLGEQLGQYKQAVRFLKDKLHEVNILNAKLLFTNKLFKEFTLDNNQKLKVVENFDRAQTTREIKLVYATLGESFSDNGSIKRKRRVVESASVKSGSTKPKRKIITEEQHVANRFKTLAGIIN